MFAFIGGMRALVGYEAFERSADKIWVCVLIALAVLLQHDSLPSEI